MRYKIYKDIKKLEAFIELKPSKLKNCGGFICHVEKNYFKTKFSKRKQSFTRVLLKSIQRSCRLSACNFTRAKLL